MLRRHAFCSSFLLLILSLTTALAQNEVAKSNRSSAVTITASASGERVRFTAPSSIVQTRLEVYNPAGRKVFDNEVRGGNVLDWQLQDGQAERLADDTYLCVVTVKSLSGKISEKIGLVTVEKSSATVQPVEASQMTAQQSQAIGPLDENASLIALKEDDRQTTTVIAHNGDDGEITRGKGALSFRIGDFFSGKDTEQMRLTPEGNLGIGITHPQARLDVDGLIRASQGIVFPDGSIQFSASKKTFGPDSLRPGQSLKKPGQGKDFETTSPDTSGTGTTGKIPKWSDGPNGVLADSNITESSGAIGINGSPNTNFKLDVNGSVLFRGSNPGFNLVGLRPAGNTWAFQTVDNDGRFRLFGQDNVNPGVERLTISLTTGNVGIGATMPATALEVNGLVRSTRSGEAAQYIQLHGGDSGSIKLTAQSIPAAEKSLFIQNLSGEATPGVNNTIQFQVGTTASPSTKMIIDKDGHVGIGTTATFATLQVRATSAGGIGVFGESNLGTSPYGVYGLSFGGTSSRAGFFEGNVEVTGTLIKPAGSFKIDHPLDPANKYLYHSFVESPDMINIYNGNVTTDASGDAEVTLPDWFEALNKNFRYQLTVIGTFAQAMVAEEIKENRFKIKTSLPSVKVSWQVTGIRQDAYANRYRIPVEELKSKEEQGSYLHPEVFGQPEEQGVQWRLRPEMMKRMKEAREKASQEKPQQSKP